MVDAIFQHKGTVDKFIGDAVMANFGTPKSHGNDAQNAFDCALLMNKKLSDWNIEREKRDLLKLSIAWEFIMAHVSLEIWVVSKK